MTKYLLALLLPATATAQILPGLPSYFPQELKQYLDLTGAQVNAITSLNGTQARFESGKNQRMAQVNQEIAYWTAQSPIDPSQLGIRYAEMEAIRRDIADKRKGTEEQIQTLLTAAQKTKIAALIEARRLAVIADLAECQRLIPGSQDSALIPASRISIGIPSTGVLTASVTSRLSLSPFVLLP